MKIIQLCINFFIRVFFHRHMIYRTAGEGRGPPFIPLYLFHQLTNIENIFATLHVRWQSHIFNRNACVYQTATRWDLLPYWIIYHLIDWSMMQCLFTWWIDSGFLLLQFWHGKLVDLNSNWLSVVLQANRLTKCASSQVCERFIKK